MAQDILRTAGFDLDAATTQRLAAFVQALHDENQRINLTGARDEAALWHHVCDCLALLRVPALEAASRLLDLGSGGGLPGVPIACVRPALNVTVLDATRKKVDAVARIVARLGLPNVATRWGRAETLAREPACQARFDIVTARAVAALPKLIPLAAEFVREDGQLWLFKSAAALGDERAAAAPAVRQHHLEAIEPVQYRLPGEATPRVLLGYQRSRRPWS